MPIHETATYHVRREGLDTCLEAIRRLVAAVRHNEPGTLRYTALQDRADPTRFLHVMTFADEAAEATHRGSEAVRRFVDALDPLTVSGVEFDEYEEIAAAE